MNIDVITKIKSCAKTIEDFIKNENFEMANFYLGKMAGMIETAFECGAISPSLNNSMAYDYLNYLEIITRLQEDK